MVDRVNQLRGAQRKLELSATEAATLEEIAAAADFNPAEAAQILAYDQAPESLDEVVAIEWDDVSPIDLTRGMLIEDPNWMDLDVALQRALLASQLEGLLDSFDERSATVIRLRFGIGVDSPMTLDQIGDVFSVTRERIRQIEKKTMEALRKSPSIRPLRDYLE